MSDGPPTDPATLDDDGTHGGGSSIPVPPPAPIGPYHLLQKIGEGGMGRLLAQADRKNQRFRASAEIT